MKQRFFQHDRVGLCWLAMVSCACLVGLCSCAPMLQRDVDQQGKAITVLQQKTQELERSLRRLQADYTGETDRLHLELQSLKARVEENERRSERALTATVARTANQEEAGQGTAEQDTQPEAGAVLEPRQPAAAAPAAPAVMSEKEWYDQAYGLYTRGEYAKARKQFQDFMQRYPSSGRLDGALYWVAQCYYKEKRFEDAISACDDVIKKFPKGSKTADAYYLQALAFCDIKDPLTAQILLETLIQNFPDSEAARLGKKKYDELKAATP